MRPGSPMIRAASRARSTAGSTHGEFTPYLAGSATCTAAVTTIASATGHHFSPRSVACSGTTGGGAAGSRPPAMAVLPLRHHARNSPATNGQVLAGAVADQGKYRDHVEEDDQ